MVILSWRATELTETVEAARSEVDWLDAAALMHDHVEWMRSWTSFDPVVEQPALRAELEDPASEYPAGEAAVFLARWRGVAVGTAAVRARADGSAELKRMYVRPVARGHGVADRLVAAVLDRATRRGCDSVWLETVRGAMDVAIAVYRRNGFVESPGRAATLSMPGVVVMERALRAVSPCA